MAVSWLDPLFVNAGGAAVEAGIDVADGARWFVRWGGRPADDDWRALLPLLQPGYGGSFEEIHERVAARLTAAGLPSELADTFPFEVAVLGADASGSAFWLSQAEAWRPHVRERYAVAGLELQFARMRAGTPGSLPLPPTAGERSQVMRAVWRSFGVHGHTPSWTSGLVDAAVRWSLAEERGGPRRLWVALLGVLRDVEPNVLHWNLFDAFWIAAHSTNLGPDLASRPPGELGGPLGVAQALLVLRFLRLEGELGDRVRRTLEGLALSYEVDGRRYGSRFSPGDLLR